MQCSLPTFCPLTTAHLSIRISSSVEEQFDTLKEPKRSGVQDDRGISVIYITDASIWIGTFGQQLPQHVDVATPDSCVKLLRIWLLLHF